MHRNLAILRQLFRFGMPAYLLALPLLMLYGSVNPWAPAELLRSQYHGQTPLLVGLTPRLIGETFVRFRSADAYDAR